MPKGDALVETIIKHIFLFSLLRLLGPFLFDCGPIKKLANVAMLFSGSKHLAHASFSNICAINNQTSPTRLVPLSSKWLLQSIVLLAIIGKHGLLFPSKWLLQCISPLAIIGKQRLLLLCLLDFSNNSIKIDVSLFVETLRKPWAPSMILGLTKKPYDKEVCKFVISQHMVQYNKSSQI